MSRILDFLPSQEEALVSRVLVQVHQAVDEHLPQAGAAQRQFTKTVFAGEGDPAKVAKSSTVEDWVVGPESKASEREPIPHFVPKPPATARPVTPPPPPGRASDAPVQKSKSVTAVKPDKVEAKPGASRPSAIAVADPHIENNKADWVSRFTVALLLAGIVMLVYVLIV